MTAYPSSITPSPTLDIPPSGFFQNEHPAGVRAGRKDELQPSQQDETRFTRNYTQRSREHFSEDARQLLFNYATTSNTVGGASGVASET